MSTEQNNNQQRNRYFITIDAETEVISEGIRIISEIREEVAEEEHINIPLIWFIRFQRTWTEYLDNSSSDYFRDPVDKCFDGFEASKPLLQKLSGMGDEVGWHYHAYNYVHRDDLSHDTRMNILEADLESCARNIQSRHPCLNITAFRFGWFFIPDYNILKALKKAGIRADASVNPRKTGKVAHFNVQYRQPIADSETELHGVSVYPYADTLLIHDWNVVPHDFKWGSLDVRAAEKGRASFRARLRDIARGLKKEKGAFMTYQDFL